MSELGQVQYDPRNDDVVMHPADYQRLRSIESAAREVIYEFSMPSELDGAEQAALEKLRKALGEK